MRKFILAFPFAFLTIIGAVSSQAVNFTAAPAIEICAGTATVSVPIRVNGFTGITSFQYSMEWDETVLQYNGVSNFNLPSFNSLNFGQGQVSNGMLTVVWFDGDLAGETLSDGSTIYQINFNVLNGAPSGATSAIAFTNNPTPQFASQGISAITVTTTNGSVTVDDNANPSISCPGNQTFTTSGSSYTVTGIAPTALSDNCGTPSVAYSMSGATTLSGSGNANNLSFNVGTTSVTYTATDGSMNSASCMFSVIVNSVMDTVFLTAGIDTALCSDNTIAIDVFVSNFTDISSLSFTLDWNTSVVTFASVINFNLPGMTAGDFGSNPGQLTFSWANTTPGGIDMPDGSAIFRLNLTTTNLPTGSTGIVFSNTPTAIIASQGLSAVPVDVTNGLAVLIDNLPVITCPSTTIPASPVSNDPGQCGAVVTWATATATDDCAPPTVGQTMGPVSGSLIPVGPPTTIQYVATDNAGQTKSCSFTITVTDTQNPLAICPASILNVALNASGMGTLPANIGGLSTDNCSIMSQTSPSLNFTCTNLGTQTVTLTATDASGNTDTETCSFTVVDNTNPVAVCPASIPNVVLNASGNGTLPANIGGLSTDNCSVTSQTSPALNFTCANLGTQTVTLTATDASGNSDTETCSFTVVDNTNPVAVCPASIANVALNAVGTGTLPANIGGLSTDNCTVTSQTSPPLNFTCASLGTQTVTLTATDASGNTDTETCSFTVIDNIAPVAICPASIPNVVLNASGNGTLPANIGGLSTDNCSVTSQTSPALNFTCANLGTQTVTLTATDASGNTDTETCSFTVVDNIPPVAICPASIPNVVLNASGNGTLPANIGGLSTDNCTVTSQTSPSLNFTCTNLGTQTVTLTATDASGNTDTETCSFTVVDNTNPVAVCPASIPNVVLNASGNGTLPANIGGLSTDNCSVTSQTSPALNFTCANLGTQTVTLTATDASGNTDTETCSFTVVDNTNPVAVCPASIPNVTLNASGNGTLPANIGGGLSTDNCSATEISPSLSFTCAQIGAQTVVLTATDPSGNTSTATCTFNVVDNMNPVAVCPPTIPDVELDLTGTGSLPANLGNGSSTDNCGSVTETSPAMSFNCADLGAQTLVLTATDASGNTNTASCSFNVVDKTPPVAICPASIPDVVLGANGTGSLPANIGDGSSTDNCSATETSPPLSFTCADVGIQTVILTATDPSGNSNTASCSFEVTENINPVAVCPATIPDVVLNASGIGTLPANIGNGSSTDNCSATETSPSLNFTCAQIGAQNVVLTATDPSGNSSTVTCSFNVVDNSAPTVSGCLNSFSVNVTPDSCNAIVTWTEPTASDNCAGLTFLTNYSPGDTLDVGVTTVTYTATDASNNQTVCSFTVTVTDNQPPTIAGCPSDLTQSTDPGECNAAVTWTAPTFDDNCAANLTVSHTSGSTFPAGTTTVTYTAEDASGNTASCDFDVTVEDDESPVLQCPLDTLVLVPSGTLDTAINDIYLFFAGDNCGVDTLYYHLSGALTGEGTGGNASTSASGTAFPVGVTTVRYFVEDAAGKVDSCSFSVTIEEVPVLTIDCPASLSVGNDAGLCSAVVNGLTPTANPPGDVQEVFYQITGATTGSGTVDASGTTFIVGISTVTYTAVSIFNDSTSCSFTVEVTDDEDPSFTNCQGGVVNNTVTKCGWVFNGAFFGAFDNCPDPVVSYSHTPGMLLPPGDHTISAQVTDAAGNSAFCSVLIVVMDTELPVIANCPANIVKVADPGVCAAIVNWTPPTATDNCTLLAFTPSQGPNTSFNVGVTPVEYVAVDDAGNVAKCQFNVTVQDMQPPVFLFCPSDIVQANAPNQCSATVTWQQPIVNDNCGVVSYLSNISSSTFDVGSTEVIYTATDAAGNIAVCIFDVQVNDTQYPFIADMPDDLTLNAAPGDCGAFVTWDAPSASDNCGLDDFGSTVSPGVFVAAGQDTIVQYIAIDINGNVTVEGFNITVLDPTPPVFVCPGNVTVSADGSFLDDPSGIISSLQAVDCQSLVLNFLTPQVSDECGLSSIQQTSGTSSGNVFNAVTQILTFLATDNNGNQSTCSFTVTVEAVAAASAEAFPPFPCEGEDVFFFVTEYPGVTYEWKNQGGTVVSTESFFILTGITAAEGGTYTVAISGGSCQQQASVEVFVQSNPVVTASANNLLCAGGDADLNLTATTSGPFVMDWIWQFPDNSYIFQQNPTVSNADEDDSGQYIVAAISSFGCVGLDTVDVLISNTPPMPTLFGTDAASCTGQPIVLNGQVFTGNNVSYHWSSTPAIGSGLTAINNHVLEVNPTQAGTYTYNFYAQVDGCTSATAEWVVNVEVAPALTLSVLGATTCVNGTTSVALDAFATGSPVVSWAWVGVNTGYASNEQNPVLSNVSTANSDIYQVTATTLNGCVTTMNLPVNFTPAPPAPQLFASTNELCLGLPVTLTVLPAYPAGTQFNWQGENLPIDAPLHQSIEVTPTSTGNLSYSVAANVNGCWTSVALVEILVDEAPVLFPEVVGNTNCVDGTTSVTLTSNVTDAAAWKWTNSENVELGTEPDLVLSSVNASFSGTYFLEVKTQVAGCFSVAQLDLNITDALGEITATHLNSFACLDEVISLCAAPAIPGATYEWRNPQGELFSTMECPVIPVASANMGGAYTVTAILEGCSTNTASVDVAVLTAPDAKDDIVVGIVDVPQGFNVVVQSDVLIDGAGYDITVVQQPMNGTVTYDGNGVMTYTPNPGFRETDRLLYQICYDDCPDACDIALVTLKIVYPGDTCVITSLITPNNDGINDEFVVSCLEFPNDLPNNTLIIFNEWGDKVFDAAPYQNDWKGTYEGKDLPDGTYFYIFVREPGAAAEKGFVMIYR